MQFEIEDRLPFKMIHVIGNIEAETSSKELDDAISKLMDEGFHHFVFNLEKTTYLDSAGISIFIHCLCDVQENKGSVYIIAGDTQVRKVLELVGITRLIKTYMNEREFVSAHKLKAA
jgi:anti-sigma B factor antagonist